MSHYKAYPAYKDSGVEWLGRVPEHWDILPLKSVVTFRSGGTPSKDNLDFWDGDIPWASAKDLKKEQLEDTQDHLTELAVTSGAASLVAAGSVLVVVRGMILARTFPVVEAMVPMAINQDLKALQALQALDEKFLAYLLRGLANESLRRLEEAGHGTKALRMELWTSMQLTIPPKEEQQSISTYLARETARIDALVAKKTRFIELLREKRQALITHAVTKGLDPNVKMKDSGMEWLGEVPEHWGVGVVSRVATRTVVGIAEAATHAYADSGTPILRSTNIRPYKIGGEILYVNADFADDRDTKLIHADDLVTVRTGNAGVTAVVPPELDGCQCFTMLITTLKDGMQSDYYCYWMNSAAAIHYFSIEGWGTAQVNISVPILKSLPVPIPPEQEQKEIVAFLLQETQRLDMLLTKTERSIELLKERRSALITAAVTGQIDLREAV